MHHSPAIAQLRQQFSRLTGGGLIGGGSALKLNLPEIDQALPWRGLARGALHEMTGDRNAIIGFLAALLGRDPRAGDVLWVTPEANLPVHRLTQFGLDHRRLTIVSARRADDRLWSIEEGLRELGYDAVVAEIDNPNLAETRHLQLAAEKSGGIGFLLCRDRQPSAALTRWRIEPASSDGYRLCWHISLEYCRNTATNLAWRVEWDAAALAFRLVSGRPRLGEQALAMA